MTATTRSIRIFEIPAQVPAGQLKGSTAIVIDVLRATSAMITALNSGCKKVCPVVSVEDAFSQKEAMAELSPLLCGERKGMRVEGFDLGNSPLEYTPEAVDDRTLIWTTTNGTRALHAAIEADNVLVAALLNVRATVEAALQSGKPVMIICAGTDGGPTLEDTVCAGLIVKEMQKREISVLIDNNSQKITELAEKHQADLRAMFMQSPHGRYLESIGFGQDLDYCARLNSLERQVTFKDSRIVLTEHAKSQKK